MPDKRHCLVCGDEFASYNGIQKVCSRSCSRERRLAQSSEHYYANRGKELARRKQYVKDWQTAHPNQTYMKCTTALWNGAKERARKSGVEFTITPLDIVVPKTCPILNEEMKRPGRYAPSLDRINPRKGYIQGNVWVVSKLANRMKNDASYEELKEFARWVKTLTA